MPARMSSKGNSGAEDRFISLFAETFGPEKAQYLHMQYPTLDISFSRSWIIWIGTGKPGWRISRHPSARSMMRGSSADSRRKSTTVY